jgi:hypothetical protein
MDNFNLRKYLTENKATANSRIVDEAYVSPEGNLEDFAKVPSSNNPEYDEALDELLYLLSDTSYYDDQEPGTTRDIAEGLENVMELCRHYLKELRKDPEASITDVVSPTSEEDFAFLKTIEATGQEPSEALQSISNRVTAMWRTYLK